MNRKTALATLVIIIIVAILIIGFFLFFQKQAEQKNFVVDAARNFFGGFFPTETTSQPNQEGSIENRTSSSNSVIPKLRQLSSFPVAGGVVFEREATSSSLLTQEGENTETNQKSTEVVYRFVERATGHIYETTARDLSQKRITNTTIPKVYEAFFSDDGENLAMVYLKGNFTETFLGKINYPKVATRTEEVKEEDTFANITGTFLPTESFGFTRSVTNNQYAFLNTTDSGTGVYTGTLATSSLNTNIFNLQTSEWKIQILKDGSFAFTTKPSLLAKGFLYLLNPKDGILKKKLGNTLGLTSLVSPDGKKIFYSYYDSGTTNTVLFDSEKKLYTTLDIATLVGDKCVWSKKDNALVFCALPNNLNRGDFPDIWYQGKYVFNDGFIKINTDDFIITNLMLPNQETDANLDAINLQLSPNEDYLMFTNKTDLTLWSLDIL